MNFKGFFLLIRLHQSTETADKYWNTIKNCLYLLSWKKKLMVLYSEIWISFWQEWLQHSTQETENRKISVLWRYLKMCSLLFLKLILKVIYLPNTHFLTRMASSQPSLLVVFSPAIFEICLCFAILSTQLNHLCFGCFCRC